MRTITKLSTAALTATLIAMPAMAAAQANHNTTRSNKADAIAHDGDDTGETGDDAGEGSGPPAPAQANHNTTRSNKSTISRGGDDADEVETTERYSDKFIVEKRKKVAGPQGNGGHGLAFNVAGEMFAGTAYDNIHQIAGASGQAHLNQPNGGPAQLMLHMTFKGLSPNQSYTIHLDRDGTTATGNHSFGPWVQVGQFTSNAAGNAQYQYEALSGTIPSGTHRWAVFVNRADVGRTVLISDNIDFTVP